MAETEAKLLRTKELVFGEKVYHADIDYALQNFAKCAQG